MQFIIGSSSYYDAYDPRLEGFVLSSQNLARYMTLTATPVVTVNVKEGYWRVPSHPFHLSIRKRFPFELAPSWPSS